MSTLHLIWPEEKIDYKLWSWTLPTTTHYVAHITRRMPGKHASQALLTARLGAHNNNNNPTEIYMPIPRHNGDERCPPAVVKMALDEEEIANLEHESAMYEVLGREQGRSVPRVFGHFRGRVDGREIACLLMEYCVPPFLGHRDDIGKFIMGSAYAIHARGVVHGNLQNDHHHIVPHPCGMMLLDLSTAQPHRCLHGRQLEVADRNGRYVVGVCPELAALERKYGCYL
uniref:Protein kinase domain-containing protein n=1 Tax=Mycena chlorophos TaxID=658473 RepID=A0ABQ0LLQ2_MYCCL|nr:predicted protein [Mycena chlorophos]